MTVKTETHISFTAEDRKKLHDAFETIYGLVFGPIDNVHHIEGVNTGARFTIEEMLEAANVASELSMDNDYKVVNND